MDQRAHLPVIAVGERSALEGLPLAGVALRAAETPDEARETWQSISQMDAIVILTPASAAAIGAHPERETSGPMTVVLPG
ncbi:hypothetical protein [Leifsonia sp. EB34]|uniref:hypothetical protein n=1 Tax=Leifsonia sp. EB34 TaxID=3156303 RepID=UPI0035126AB2